MNGEPAMSETQLDALPDTIALAGMAPHVVSDADRHALEAANDAGVDVAQGALIDARGVDEAVADDPFAALERRDNHGADMVIARRGEQDGLDLRAERLGCA